ncbi:F0F1 ATP synthase subunit B family protein [Limobrevibacterium gyesilva]|uniref:ATP synthase subunit b n=1 Tax=Limobrevibacterium gyesilva TaxID=2991712 RepID=A0AA41YMN6_9PROT|nr:F0F1 ATP synthase subunit B' [Limobrevibacterium gyesilva]MCW3476706.1 F0F1 ATP synthase subunit B' [Limobrevibacterium gyesilva]
MLLSSTAFAEEAKKGMPQLDATNPLILSQVVWLAIIFLALYLLLSRWALPQVAEVLEARAATIGRDLDAARAAKAAADEAVAELTKATRTAQAGAQAEIAGAVAAAKDAAAAQSAQLNAKLDAQLDAAERQIAGARTAALGALRQVATDTASVVVSRLTGIAPDVHAVDSAVGAALAARGVAAGHA